MNKTLKKILLVLAVIYAILIMMGIFDYIPPNFYKLHQANFSQALPPSADHLLGTDWWKKDVFTEFVYGAKSTFYSGMLAGIPFLIFGILLGVGSAYQANRTSYYLDKLLEILNSFPKLIVLLIIIGLFGNHMVMLMMIFGIISAPKLAELIKGKVLALRKEAFVDSSIALGLSHAQIIFKHILYYNCRHIIIGQFFFIYAAAILVEASLSYVNLGFSQTSASWGYMLSEARSEPKTLFTWPWDSDFNLKAFVVISSLTLLTLSMVYLAEWLKNRDHLLKGIE
ncbi:ABC-type transporter, integral membrane subunit [Caldithrix abyssi DSM 13497]|uniref:ABC-type transporter, integral membrane subunit n=1 Tax=Caldithrix abyssi DSM 13497 TaxID=880073 RepID=H1XNW8_CALAY|nr:ABC transporter permease [Caldithrix abyssi]APF19804.1 peptide/nickel transport system permease protein [Caldithrix abyssi DSM 13497]EHO39908.1 ABC-type transporter, integral membrane subunit [Caldithrix abyssi DSM 13497]